MALIVMLALMQIISVLIAGNCIRVGMSLFNLIYFCQITYYCFMLHLGKARQSIIRSQKYQSQPKAFNLSGREHCVSCSFTNYFIHNKIQLAPCFSTTYKTNSTVDITNESVLYCRNHCLASSVQSENTVSHLSILIFCH